MFVAKPGFLLLCATAVAERTRLQVAATVTADISPCLLTSSTILCSTGQEHQQRRSGRNCPITQVQRERSGTTCVSAKRVSSTEHLKIRCSDGTDKEASVGGRESPDSRFQRRETRSNGTSKPIKEVSRILDSGKSYNASHITSYGRERSSSSSAGRTNRNDITSSKTHSLDDIGTSNGYPSSYKKDGISHCHTVNRSAVRNAGSSKGVACRVWNGDRRRESSSNLFTSSRQHNNRVPPRTVQPVPSAGLVEGSLRRDHEDSKLRTTVALDAISEEKFFDFFMSKRSAADAASSARASRRRHTLQLPAIHSLNVSISTTDVGRQQADFLSLFRLFSSSRTRKYLRAVATGAALQMKKTRGLPVDTPWRQRRWSHSVSSRQAKTRSSTFPNICPPSALVFSIVPFLNLSPTHYSFASRFSSVSSFATPCSYQLHFCYPSCTAVTHLLLSTPRLLLSSLSNCNNLSPSCISSSACAPSPSVSTKFLSASLASSFLPLCSSVTITTSGASSAFSLPSFFSMVRCSSALFPSHSSSEISSVSRLLHPPSSLGSLLSPRLQTSVEAGKFEELKEKLNYIGSLVQNTPVVLFMKGTPREPACGFSRMTYELLELASNQVNEAFRSPTAEKSKIRYSSITREPASTSSHRASVSSSPHVLLSDPNFFRFINVLDDDLMREGIKQYSEWPTIPQLYVRGQFIGGADITAAMFRDKSLHKAVKSALLAVNHRLGEGK